MNKKILACTFITLCSCTGVAARPAIALSSSDTVVVTTLERSPSEPAQLERSRAADFTFDGVDEFAAIQPSLPRGSEPRTLTAWFRTSVRDGAHVIANWGTPNVGQRFGLLVDAGRVKLVGEFQDIMTTNTFADGRWHHAAATFDGSYAIVYLDGRPEVSGHLQLDTRGDRFVVGNAPIAHSPEYWIGEIDEVAVYDRVLEADAIAALARAS
jgi:hypothetical protein